MPLQASGPISITQIRTELINETVSYSLRALSAAANKTSEDAMSEFYNLDATPTLSVEYLLVGGGAGAGGSFTVDYGGGDWRNTIHGGGGAGRLIEGALTLNKNQTYTVTVGAGGGGGSPYGNSLPGASSVFAGLTAQGGHAGGSGGDGYVIYRNLGDPSYVSITDPTAAGSPFSNSGGNHYGTEDTDGLIRTGGGGGAGGAGGNASAGAAGSGGAGKVSSITGTAITYATGGGGGSMAKTFNATPIAGASGGNYGGGGGSSSSYASVAGNNGVVIIRIPNTLPNATITGGGTLTNISGYKVYTFTSNGTILFNKF